MTCTKEDFETFWKSYLDLERSYEEIAAGLPKDDFTQKAVKYGFGLEYSGRNHGRHFVRL